MTIVLPRDGKFSIEVDIQDFDPEDIDLRVEDDGKMLVLVGEHQVKRQVKIQFGGKFESPA